MRLTALAVADEVNCRLYDHFDPDRWREVDMVLSCGDLPPTFLDFLCTNLGVPVFYVRGNHDSLYTPADYAGFENVHGRIVTYRGVRIAGFEGSMRYKTGAVQYSDAEMRRIVWRTRLRAWVQGAPNIVLSHAPIGGFHDGTDACHRGFASFRGALDAWKPQYFVHGHTHMHYSRESVSHFLGTTVINAFPLQTFQIDAQPASDRGPLSAMSHLVSH